MGWNILAERREAEWGAAEPSARRRLGFEESGLIGTKPLYSGRDHHPSNIRMPRLGLRLTPHGHLIAEAADDAPGIDESVAPRLGQAFPGETDMGCSSSVPARSGKPCRRLRLVARIGDPIRGRTLPARPGRGRRGAVISRRARRSGTERGRPRHAVLTAPMMAGAE